MGEISNINKATSIQPLVKLLLHLKSQAKLEPVPADSKGGVHPGQAT